MAYVYGVVRNGEHLALFDTKAEAEAKADAERVSVVEAAAAGWTSNRGADETRVWVERISGRRRVW